MRLFLRLLSILGTIILLSAVALAQNEPAGGRVPATPSPKPKPKTDTATPAPKKSGVSTPSRQTGQLDRIDGKWWTTGNGFGDSEVIFSQNGSSISGVINYADGRTGTINGTLVGKRLHHTWTNSTGDGGSGWLELSWANFLGGPWRNARVKDGSWTLNRIEGQWCFGGDRSRPRRVTHDARGHLTIVTEDGTQEEGQLEGPWLFLIDDNTRIKGDMFYKANRVNWQNGTFWTWCGR